MTYNANKTQFKRNPETICGSYGISSVVSAVFHDISVKASEVLENTKFSSFIKNSEYPDYMNKSLTERLNPSTKFPASCSIVIAAVPFRILPEINMAKIRLRDEKSPLPGGKIAGYALKLDYHRYAKSIFKEFMIEIKEASGVNFSFECFSDTKAISEKVMAQVAGAGIRGLNSCLRVPGEGSGCFIVSAICDRIIPEFKVESSLEIPDCGRCGACLKKCPNNVLSESHKFKYSKCISALTMEFRGYIEREQRNLMRGSIFGCDICTAACLDSKLPASKEIDLEWLLFSPSKEIENAFRESPASYAGITILRRNALAALEYAGTEQTFELVRKLKNSTGSEILIRTAEDILKTSD